MKELKIDAELKALIPPLRESEYTQLEQNILSEGIREPILTWNGTIIDGHNRYSIAKKHGLNFAVKEMQFDNKDAAIGWMIYNQFGRRNLSVYDSVCLALKLKPQIEAEAKKRKLATQNNNTAKNLQGADTQNFAHLGSTRDKIAALAGVSRETVRKVEKINELATHIRSDDIIAGLRSGGLSISLALEGLQYRKEDLDRRTAELKLLVADHRRIVRETYKLICMVIYLYENNNADLPKDKISEFIGNIWYKETGDEYFNPKTFNVYQWRDTNKKVCEDIGVDTSFDPREIPVVSREKFMADIKKLAAINKAGLAEVTLELAKL